MTINHLKTVAVLHRTSRKIACYAAAFALFTTFGAASASAQADTERDSLAARLRRAEQAIAVLQQQVGEQSQGGARTRSGMRIELHGRVAVNGFGNSRRVNNVDDPQFVRPDTTGTVSVRGIGMAIRQTTLGLAVSSPDVLGGAFSGDLDVDFYGGQQPSSGGRTFPLLRIRTARGFVRWSHAELMLGQDTPLISGLNPVTPAAIGTPDFATAGNLWLWLPQVRGDVERGDRVRVGLQAAVLAPTSGDAAGAFDTDYDLAERSQMPFLQARAHMAWITEEIHGDVGCGVHQGWLVRPTLARDRVQSFAVACDALVPVTSRFDFRGEGFDGQALRGLGGGGIGQNFNTVTNEPLRTVGGWGQLNFRLSEMVASGFGGGTDQPHAGAPRRRNDAWSVYTTVRPAGPLFVGAELRRLRTEYATQSLTSDHVTISAGFEF